MFIIFLVEINILFTAAICINVHSVYKLGNIV